MSTVGKMTNNVKDAAATLPETVSRTARRVGGGATAWWSSAAGAVADAAGSVVDATRRTIGSDETVDVDELLDRASDARDRAAELGDGTDGERERSEQEARAEFDEQIAEIRAEVERQTKEAAEKFESALESATRKAEQRRSKAIEAAEQRASKLEERARRQLDERLAAIADGDGEQSEGRREAAASALGEARRLADRAGRRARDEAERAKREARELIAAAQEQAEIALDRARRVERAEQLSETLSDPQHDTGEPDIGESDTGESDTGGDDEQVAGDASAEEDLGSKTKDELYSMAQRHDVQGRSDMTKSELVDALQELD